MTEGRSQRSGAGALESRYRRPGGATFALFTVAVVLGAGNFLGVRFSNAELDPFWGAGLRFALAAVTFIAIASALRLRWPRGRDLTTTMTYGFLNFFLFYALMYWAIVRVTAGVATVVMAIVPLATLLIAAAQGLERLTWRGVVGAAIALAGIVWMTFGPNQVDLPLDALAAMVAAAAAAAEAIIVGKRLSHFHPAMTNAVAMTVGAALLLVLSLAVGETRVLPELAATRWALLYLVTFGSVGLFVLVLLVVRRWTASVTSYMFVLFPVVTIGLEAWLLDEPVTAQALIGAAVVMVGVWFGALSPSARASRLGLST